MPTPTWSAATPGQATLAGQVNQFLVAHPSNFVYSGTSIRSALTASANTDTFSLTQTRLAFRFATPASPTQLTRVNLALGAVGAGCDVLIQLQGDTGSGPNGVTLTSCYIPAEWLNSGTQSAPSPDHGFPLSYLLDPSAFSYYNIVITPVSPWLPSVDSVVLTRSTATSGAYIYNGSWSAQSYGYVVNLYTGNSGNLRITSEDSNALLKGYDFNSSNVMTYAREFVAKSSSAPYNLLSRDDATPTVNTGSWGTTTGTLTRSNSLALYNTYSLRFSAPGGTTSMRAYTNYADYPVTAGIVYSACASIAPGGTTLRNIQVSIDWHNSAGSVISTSAGVTELETAQNVWNQVTVVSQTAPATAVYASVVFTISAVTGNLTASELHYIDEIGLFQSANTTWSYPGLGVSSVRSITVTSGAVTSIS